MQSLAPRTLEELLKDISERRRRRLSSDSSSSSSSSSDGGDSSLLSSADSALSAHPWGRPFLRHLTDRKMSDEAAALKFLVVTQPVVKDEGKRKKKDPESEAELERVFHLCAR